MRVFLGYLPDSVLGSLNLIFHPLPPSPLLQLAEIKHARLAMAAWLGFLAQAFATNPGPGLPSYSEGAIGPYAAWAAHVANPWTENAWKALR